MKKINTRYQFLKLGYWKEIIVLFFIFLRLGSTSFGGPIAQLGYFRKEFVEKRGWLNEHTYVDLIALCQLLPGPVSGQITMAIGLSRASYLGAIISWLAFTLPSTTILILFAYRLVQSPHALDSGWLHGLSIVAVAVVAQAVWMMGKTICRDGLRIMLALTAALFTIFYPSVFGQIICILLGGIIGGLFLRGKVILHHIDFPAQLNKWIGFIALSIFFILLLVLPSLNTLLHSASLQFFEKFYRVGALVFGGPHVILPLLEAVVVPTGLISNQLFLAGYGITQAMPGPLFSFAAYIGTLSATPPNSLAGAIIAILGIYFPSFLLIMGVLPFWETLRRFKTIKWAMQGINAAVVGLLLAALYKPVWTTAIHTIADALFALVAFLLLHYAKWPAWLVVIIGAIAGKLGQSFLFHN